MAKRKPLVYYDPPELEEYAERGSPPPDLWPGARRTRYDVMAACGDSRDWFRFWWRYEAFCRHWGLWVDAWNRRGGDLAHGDYGFNFNLILILGPYGRGKTSLGIYECTKFSDVGHPIFSNAACLLGWRLDPNALYTAIADAPKHASFLLDEASTDFASGMGSGVAISIFGEQLLNTRKQNVKGIFITAQDYALAKRIRQEIFEVWMPVPKDKIHIVGASYGVRPLLPAADPSKFQTAWLVWTDFPYRRNNLIEGDEGRGAGNFGPPSFILYQDGDPMRDAYLLTDTFELARAGSGRVADKDVIKDATRRQLGINDPADEAMAGLLDYILGLEGRTDFGAYVTATEIAESLNVANEKVGLDLRKLFPSIRPKRGHGYAVEDLLQAAADKGLLQDGLKPMPVVRDIPLVDRHLMEWLQVPATERPQYLSVGRIAEETDIRPQEVGKAISRLGGHHTLKQRHGYDLGALLEVVKDKYEEDEQATG